MHNLFLRILISARADAHTHTSSYINLYCHSHHTGRCRTEEEKQPSGSIRCRLGRTYNFLNEAQLIIRPIIYQASGLGKKTRSFHSISDNSQSLLCFLVPNPIESTDRSIMDMNMNLNAPHSMGTTIIGVTYDGGVVLGADSRTSTGKIFYFLIFLINFIN